MKFLFIMGSICLFLSGLTMQAQNYPLSGQVVDGEQNQSLVGAHIQILDREFTTATNALGKFRFQNLPAGDYKLLISHIGYERKTVSVSVNETNRTPIQVTLQPSTFEMDDVVVTQDATQNMRTISKMDIQLRPITTSQDVLTIVPGLFIAQHAGGGKAEQIFLRGFDIDHGTDIALQVDGMPVNMVSHAHGQGYADLHFVIPETLQQVQFDKGPYYADQGNLNTAGYADFRTKHRLNRNEFKIEGGQFGTFRTVGMFNLLSSEKATDPSLYLATEYYRTDGYFDSPQHFNRFNTLLKYYQQLSTKQTLELSFSAFTSSWDASGQIPVRAVESGQISRFGAIDDTEGGKTSRVNFNANLLTDLPNGGYIENQAYASFYDFSLVSNFTFFLEDPINGDQITQSESRKIFGSKNTYWKDWNLLGLAAETQVGVGFRYDEVDDVRLSQTLNRNEVLNDLARGDVKETNLFLFAAEKVALSNKLSVSAGVRYDHFTFDYLDALSTNYDRKVVTKDILTPKLQVNYKATDKINFFVKSGIGFHSNDTRVVVAQGGEQILPKAYGTDVGALWKPIDRLLVQVALWRLDLDQEFVYVGDAGIVEAGGKTQRQGIDLSLRYQVNDWLTADFDMNYTDAQSVEDAEGENFIPLAPSFTSIGGLNFTLTERMNASLRYRFLEDRPANEFNSLTAEGYFLLDLLVNYQWQDIRFGLSVENLTDTEWKEAQFETESRLFNEGTPTSEIHFTPGTPFQARLSVSFLF